MRLVSWWKTHNVKKKCLIIIKLALVYLGCLLWQLSIFFFLFINSNLIKLAKLSKVKKTLGKFC